MLIYHHDFSNAGNNPLFMSCIFKNQSGIKKKKKTMALLATLFHFLLWRQ